MEPPFFDLFLSSNYQLFLFMISIRSQAILFWEIDTLIRFCDKDILRIFFVCFVGVS